MQIVMTTLRHMATLASGLYQDTSSGQVYLEDALLDQVPDEVLSRPIRLERKGRGVYSVHVMNGGGRVFTLLSRRNQPRG